MAPLSVGSVAIDQLGLMDFWGRESSLDLTVRRRQGTKVPIRRHD
jgi:hypothetical protein